MHFLLTLDYELWGDGSGDVFTTVIQPTERILSLCNKYGVKVTIFFEILEYIKLKEQIDIGNWMGYKDNPVTAIEEQLKQAILSGHDVQLHLHPQFWNANYIDGGWQVDNSMWCLGRINDMSLINRMFATGKTVLEKLFKPIKSSYSCVAFRAGGYNICPGIGLADVLRHHEIKIDSSVYNGGKENNDETFIDFSNVDDKMGYWFVQDDLKESASQGDLLELPILSIKKINITKYLTLRKITEALGSIKNFRHRLYAKTGASLADNKQKQSIWKKVFFKFAFLFAATSQNWDVTIISPWQQRAFLRKAEQLNLEYQREYFTIIGHPKCLKNLNTLKLLLQYAQRHNCNFDTMTSFLNNFNKVN